MLACSCEAWRVPAASAHATVRRSQRTPPLTPRRSALLMSEDDTDMAEAAQPSTVRCFLAHHVTRHATPHEYATPPRTAPCTVPRTMPCTMPRTTHRAPHATHHAPRTTCHAPGAQGRTGRYADGLPRLSGREHHLRVDRSLPDRRRRVLRAGGARQVRRQEPLHALGVWLLVVVSDVHGRDVQGRAWRAILPAYPKCRPDMSNERQQTDD